MLRVLGLACILIALAGVRLLSYPYQRAVPTIAPSDLVYGFAAPAAYLITGVVLLRRR